ncbi:MAG: transcriptional repressor [Bacteroidales bacterium]|nr:transcriptional repressor [Bacteroidales bacterium]
MTIHEVVEQRLRQYLIANGMRQTKERFAILRAVYDLEGTFRIEDMEQTMQNRRFRVSRATLYSTIQVLVQANLLIRHPFSSASAMYERIVDDRPRSYQICNNCHHITRIKSKDLAVGLDSYRPRSFTISHRVVYVYGICAKCNRALRKQYKHALATKKDT